MKIKRVSASVFVVDCVYMKRLRFGMGICISSGN